ncbi:MAG: universal stress protein [Bacteroidota bacterium]
MKTILIPVDFSDHASPTYKFAIKIAGTKTSTELVFLHSYNDQIMIPDSAMSSEFNSDSYMNMQLIEEFKKLAENNMKKLSNEVKEYLKTKSLNNFSIKTIVEGGDPDWEIRSVCDEIKPSLIVMGTQGNGKKGVLEGSMAKKIMNKAMIPVLAVPVGTNEYESFNIMYASNKSEKDFNKIKLLYKLFENIPTSIFAVHFQLTDKSSDDIQHINDLKEAFADEMNKGKFHFSLVNTNDKYNALEAFVEHNKINSIAFIAHKTNIFKSLFKHEITKNDFFKLGLPMIALHE